jgi:hypothetical protein
MRIIFVKHNLVNLSGGVTSAAQINQIMLHIETGHEKHREQMQREEYDDKSSFDGEV